MKLSHVDKKSPLVELEVALRGGYLRDGWMTSRVDDIMWLSEYETPIFKGNCNSIKQYIGIPYNLGAESPSILMSPGTYQQIRTPSICNILSLPTEVLTIINLSIRDALNISQTCKRFHSVLGTPESWRYRLQKDLNCTSMTHDGQSSREMLQETYKLVFWSEK